MEEREISIVDLMVEILLHWRMFIICMLIGAVLLGAFSYTRSSNAVKRQKMQAEEGQNPEENLSEQEIDNVNYIVNFEKAHRVKKAYQEESLFMQLDPDHISKAEATIVIDGGELQRSYDIEKVYEDIVVSGELIEKTAEKTGMKTADINEMLFLSSERSGGNKFGATDDTSTFRIVATDDTSTFRIVATHSDEAQSKKMLEAVIALLKEKKPDVENILGEHELIVGNESFGIVSDMQIAEKQITTLNDMAGMRKTLSDAKDKLSAAEQQYYDFLISEEVTDEVVLPKEVPMLGISKKYVLLGAIMAAFVYAFILLLVYIFNTKIRATDSMQELYGLPQLGMIPAVAGKKKVLGVVDKWIISIRDHNKRQFSSEEALELAAVAAKMAAGKEALQDVCLMGCALNERSLEVCGKIKDRLEEEGIRTAILNNVLYDAQTLGELEGAKGVILVESAGSTLYNEIAEELELLKRQGIKALGGILVG